MTLGSKTFALSTLIGFAFAVATACSHAEALELRIFMGQRMPLSNSALLMTEDKALLIDAQFFASDARDLIGVLEASKREPTAILLTHGHPDHVFGAAEVKKRYPDVVVYARASIKREIELEFRARLLRWSEVHRDEMPNALPEIQELNGDVFLFEGHRVEVIDIEPAETLNATAFYVPELKAYVSGDQLFHKFHPYVAGGLNRPDVWIESIASIQKNYEIDLVVPGHGPMGDATVLDAQLEYLRAYDAVSKPKVRQAAIADAMLAKFPDYALKEVLFMTRGPAVTSPELLKRLGGELGFSEDH